MKAVVPLCELLLVVGSRNSSNSKRLVEVCENHRVPAYRVDDASEIDPAWFERVNTVAVTAGASAPEHLVQALILFLGGHGFRDLEEIQLKDEDVRFSLPSELVQFAGRLATISAP